MTTGLQLSNLCQVEIPVTDLQRAKQFFKAVFGLVPVELYIHDKVILDVPSDCPYGLTLSLTDRSKLTREQTEPSITLYFRSDNPDQILGAAKKLSEISVQGPEEIAGYGTLWLIIDRDNNRFGIFRPYRKV